MGGIWQQLNSDLAGVVAGVQRTLVRVASGGGHNGAGTIWHPQGLIVTVAHVVPTPPVTVTLADGRVLPARLLARDAEGDLAALAVDAADLPTVVVGDSRTLRPGQLALALGYPWGVAGAVTAGAIIGVGPETPTSGQEWVVASLRLRPGNSGGPLVDERGRLIGVNTRVAGPDVGMAIPVHVIKAFLRRTLEARKAAA